MPATKTTPEQKAEALRCYAEHGPAEASRRTGIPSDTIRQWAVRAGVTVTRRETIAAAVETAKQTLAQQRAELAADLLSDARRLRASIWTPINAFHWGSSSERLERGLVLTRTEFMEHEIPQPTPNDQKNLLLAAAIAIDKSNLLAGEATSRTETLNPEDAKRRLVSEFPGVLKVVEGGASR